MSSAKKAAKELPSRIAFSSRRNIGYFLEKVGEFVEKEADEITLKDFDDLTEEEMQECNSVLTDAVAGDIYEYAAVEYGNYDAFYEKRNHIMMYIADPDAARYSLSGERPTSKVYDVYEMIFGKYRDIDNSNILMVYDICYYLLAGKPPKRKGQLEALNGYHSVFQYLESILPDEE